MTTLRHGTRTKARKRALDILFEAELRGRDALETLDDHIAAGHPPVREFTRVLVSGVNEHREAIDARISASLDAAWTLDRMPRVDRNLARIAVYEIDYTEVAPEVAIGEAVALSAELSTDESPGFLNGMLAVVLTSAAKGR
ncbi:MAG: transcription antitermination factor NusB [Propionibacteriaceae bacterium]|nr:transcription antitermination factor NusB [Propionibacteriaceae bacterium]